VWDAVEDATSGGGGGGGKDVDVDQKPKIGPCDYYYGWCKWGVKCKDFLKGVRGYPWTQSVAECDECYEECKQRGNQFDSWPFDKCPLKGKSYGSKPKPPVLPGPRWPKPEDDTGEPPPEAGDDCFEEVQE
jgi:hypothetical protein